MNKETKRILAFVLGIPLLIILMGMYKFNYLSEKEGYDVDGNNILPHDTNIEVHDFATCVQGGGVVREKYPDQCVYDGDMVFVKNQDDLMERLQNIHAVVEINEQGQRELVFPDFPIRPIQALSVDERNDFQNAILAGTGGKRTREAILSAFPGLQEEDFANTGNVQDNIDFQILLNNYLERVALEPQSGEQLSLILKDMKQGGE